MKLFYTVILQLFLLHSLEASRIKDILSIKGVRENPLLGYGLVIGLNGTGDGGGEIVDSSLKRMFRKLGLDPKKEVSSKNVASVIVTAMLPPFARTGQKIDITVSSISDAKSLAGGTLMITPLRGGNGEVYAVANGAVSLGGDLNAKFATTGKIINGAIIEREIFSDFDQKKSLRLTLFHPDFTTSYRIQKTINTELGGQYASSRDSGTIDLIVPVTYQRKIVEFVALIENFKVNIDTKAQIIINERTGTIVAGGDVSLQKTAIAHGDLMIEVVVKGKEGGGAGGGEGSREEKLFFLDKKTSLNDLVKGLNAIGTSPKDLISIFQTLKQNGGLVGEIRFI